MSERSVPDRPGPAPDDFRRPTRRELLAFSGMGAAGLILRRQGSGSAAQGFPIPADKGLDPAWLRSLVERGEPAVARGDELRRIGMPVGGIGCGQLYLGGDGRLWHWDLFNAPPPRESEPGSGAHYRRPLLPEEGPLSLTVHLTKRSGGAALPLAGSAFEEVEFRGTYPIGTVTYRSAARGLEIELEAFSPFVPTALEASSLPATLLAYRVRNTGAERMTVELRGRLENLVLASSDPSTGEFQRSSRSVRSDDLAMVVHGAEPPVFDDERPDILFEDFERSDWEGWEVEGTAFGPGPLRAAEAPDSLRPLDADGERLAHSHRPREGESEAAADARVGTLTSREFLVERYWIHFLMGGANNPGETTFEVLLDDQVVAELTGDDQDRLRPRALYVGDILGATARIRIADRSSGARGSLGVDRIVFSDEPGGEPLDSRPDYGSMALGLLGPGWDTDLSVLTSDKESEFDAYDPYSPSYGLVSWKAELEPGAEGRATFLLAWHFPNLSPARLAAAGEGEPRRRHYATRFADAAAVANHVAGRFEELATATRLWRDTWYDSSLPRWLLDRTLANASTLATSTSVLLDDGRLDGWEGPGCCPGTCAHVWHYAHSVARLFPALEREQRERVDLGSTFEAESGRIGGGELAVDGQAGTVLRVWREHLGSADDTFLRRVYPRARKALECLMVRDPDGDGILDGPQYNTLESTWYGAIPRLSSLYLAAVRAGEAMAEETGDAAFAARCRAVREAGTKTLVARLFDGERFVQRLDPAHPEAVASGEGCEIDQVLGQSWAHQVGLGRILPERETRSALRALWTYNFAPDVGPYRKYMESRIPGGRQTALASEAGTLTCTWPEGGHEVALGTGKASPAAAAFNECRTGFEHQLAAHMLWEGLVESGLAVERAVHDRYHPAKRNPYNEIECADHHARAMASHGVFLAVCGFELHGPKGHLGFAPRLTPERFRAAFTAPEGWGTWDQAIDASKGLDARLELRHGRLRLLTLRIGHAGKAAPGRVEAKRNETPVACTLEPEAEGVLVRFETPLELGAFDSLSLALRPA